MGKPEKNANLPCGLCALCTTNVQNLEILLNKNSAPHPTLPLEGGGLALWSKLNYSTG